jgi:hypothetical protein
MWQDFNARINVLAKYKDKNMSKVAILKDYMQVEIERILNDILPKKKED